MLDADTRYLPLMSDLSMSPLQPLNLAYLQSEDRPRTAPSGSDKRTGHHGTGSPSDHSRRSVDRLHPTPGRWQDSGGQGAVGDDVNARRVAAKLASSHSGGQGAVSNVRVPPHQDIAGSETTDDSNMDLLSTDSSQASLELKLLKALLLNRNKTRRSLRKSRDRGGGSEAQRSDADIPSATVRSSSTQSPYKPQYTPDKYRSPTRKSLKKLDSAGSDTDRNGNIPVPTALAKAPPGEPGLTEGEVSDNGQYDRHWMY